MRMRFGSRIEPSSSGWKRWLYTARILSAQHQHRSRDDDERADDHRPAARLAEKEPTPRDAENRNEISHRQRSRGADVCDQPEIQYVRDRAADNAKGQQREYHRHRG